MKRRPLYDHTGRPVATIDQTAIAWLGVLVAECPGGHCYILPDGWHTEPACCPVCGDSDAAIDSEPLQHERLKR
jgi:hypothetical protein